MLEETFTRRDLHFGFGVTTNMSPISHPSWFIRPTIMWVQMDIKLLIPMRMDVQT